LTVVVDTSVWIDFLNGRGTGAVRMLSDALEQGDLVFLPGLVLTEILQGVDGDEAAEELAERLLVLPMPPELDDSDYIAAAALYRDCRNIGQTPRSTIDCLIARTCLVLQVPILAQDRDYETIARVAPLRVLSPPD
jgi:predicted nucleic acid-binding protein